MRWPRNWRRARARSRRWRVRLEPISSLLFGWKVSRTVIVKKKNNTDEYYQKHIIQKSWEREKNIWQSFEIYFGCITWPLAMRENDPAASERAIPPQFEVNFESDDDVTCEESSLSLSLAFTQDIHWYLLIKIDDGTLRTRRNVRAVDSRRPRKWRWLIARKKKSISLMWHTNQREWGEHKIEY